MIDPVGERRPPISPQLAWRVAVLGGIALLLFAIVFFRLWYLQVLSGDQYLAEANDNQVRQERIQAPRGDIVDRNGETIVTNRRAIVVEISPTGLPAAEREAAATWGQKMSQRALRPDGFKGEPVKIPDIPTQELRERLRRLAAVLDDTTATEIQRRIVQSLAQVPYAPIRVETDVPRSVMNYVQERQTLFPNVTVEQVYLRQYPRTTLAAQMLGTVGEIQLKQLEVEAFPRRQAGHGRRAGRPGVPVRPLSARHRRIARDPGRRARQPEGRAARGGAEGGSATQAVARPRAAARGPGCAHRPGQPRRAAGAFVAMNPENGEILGMGSYPSFDPNLLTKPITQERYDQLFGEQAGSPLFNRATNGLYSTGSTFKVATALAALQSGTISPSTRIDDNGCVEIGDRKFCNAKSEPNGSVDMQQAIKVSSDVYFYLLGQNLDARKGQVLQKYARELGFGRDTGIDLPTEADGVVPDRAWRKVRRRGGAEVPQEAQGRELRHLRHARLEHRRQRQPRDRAGRPAGHAAAARRRLRDARRGRPACRRRTSAWRSRTSPASSSSASSARPPGASRSTRAPGRSSWTGCTPPTSQAGGTSYDVFSDWPKDLPVYGKTGTAQRTGKPDSVLVRGLRAGRSRAVPDRRRDDGRGVRLLRRRGRGADHAADPLAALRDQEGVRRAGARARDERRRHSPRRSRLRCGGVLRLPLDPLLIVATLGLAAISLAAIGISTPGRHPGLAELLPRAPGDLLRRRRGPARRHQPGGLLAAARAEVRRLRLHDRADHGRAGLRLRRPRLAPRDRPARSSSSSRPSSARCCSSSRWRGSSSTARAGCATATRRRSSSCWRSCRPRW